jgi:hypothetical protein
MSRSDSGFIPHPTPRTSRSPSPLEPDGIEDHSDAHLGAIEGDRPSDPEQQGNRNVPALDEQGLPRVTRKIAEDVIGANEDETRG